MARTRSERARSDVLEAAREVLLERGLEGFTVEAVAARSGVAKTTIYRHWSNAHELLVDTLRGLVDTFPTPNTGSLRDDLLAHHRHGLGLLAQPGMRSVLLGMVQAAEEDPDIRTLHDELIDQRQHPLRIILELAVGRGELPTGLDLDLAEDLFEGPLLSRILIRGGTLDERELEHLIDWAIAGLKSPVSTR
jgi:AcrR family transcriptional regulator